MNIIPLTGDTRTIGTIGTAADRGCVRCQEQARPPQAGARTVAAQLGLQESDLVIDDRGRYWHARCAAITLAEFTRFLEDRGAAYHYERTFELPAPPAAPPQSRCKDRCNHVWRRAPANILVCTTCGTCWRDA